MAKKKSDKKILRCWEFFHCTAEAHGSCLMAEVKERRCWLVNIACCKIDKDTPMPLSVKKIVCKTCEYYKAYSSIA